MGEEFLAIIGEKDDLIQRLRACIEELSSELAGKREDEARGAAWDAGRSEADGIIQAHGLRIGTLTLR